MILGDEPLISKVVLSHNEATMPMQARPMSEPAAVAMHCVLQVCPVAQPASDQAYNSGLIFLSDVHLLQCGRSTVVGRVRM
jgi:hypothetical protein